MSGIGSPISARNVFARLFGRMSNASDHEANVAELHWSDGRSVQISSYPDNDGVLIRVWGENGTHEYGGSNLSLFSAALRFTDGDGIEIESLDVRKPMKAAG
jgi:hypothetical protein